MLELHLGTVDANDDEGAASCAGVMRDSSTSLPAGRYELIGRFDSQLRTFISGALTRNLGNDQWYVQLINVQQLARLAQSEFVHVRREIADRGHSLPFLVAAPLIPEVVAHLVGLGSVAIASRVAYVAASAAREAVVGVEPQAQHIAENLAQSGINPASKHAVRSAVLLELER